MREDSIGILELLNKASESRECRRDAPRRPQRQRRSHAAAAHDTARHLQRKKSIIIVRVPRPQQRARCNNLNADSSMLFARRLARHPIRSASLGLHNVSYMDIRLPREDEDSFCFFLQNFQLDDTEAFRSAGRNDVSERYLHGVASHPRRDAHRG